MLIKRRSSGAVLALVVGVAVLVPVQAAHAATTPYRGSIVSWNMSGWKQHKGAVRPADVLAANVLKRAPLPTAIVVNEMCSTQYDQLVAKLGPSLTNTTPGYKSVPNWSLPNFSQPGCPKFGNAVFYLGDKDPSPYLRTYTAQASSDPFSEQRNLICVAFSTVATSTEAATPLRICGTHLHPTDSLAALQLGEARKVVGDYNAGTTATLLAGDLNMAPGLAAFDDWYNGGYTEADLSGRTRPRATTTSNVKLDFGFVPTAKATVSTTAKIEMQYFVSDHAIFTTYFALKN
jgi:hypothetical protein